MTVSAASALPARRRRPPVWLLVGLTALGPFALNVFVPSLPGIAVYFVTDLPTVQLALSLYLVSFAVAQLIYGPLSDRFGRRPVLLTGLGIYVAASVLCAVAPSVEALIAGRVLQAFGACAGQVLGRAIVRDVYGREGAASALGYITTAMAVVPALAPAVGGYLEEWFSWRASFVAVLLFGVAVLAAALAVAHETNPVRRAIGSPASLVRDYVSLLRSRPFLGYALNVALTTSAFFAFIAIAPVLMIDVMHRPPSEYGLYAISVSGSYMVGNFLAGRYSPRVGLERMAWTGAAIGAAVAIAMVLGAAVVTTPLVLFLPFAVVAVGNGLCQPNAIAGAISADPRLAGAASGLLGFLQMSLGALVTAIVGHLPAATALPLAATIAVCLALALAAVLLARPR